MTDETDPASTSEPRILFVADVLNVDLNSASLPEIISVVRSEAGLKQVNRYIIKKEDSEMLYESSITSFADPNNYSFSLLIPYTEDVTGFRVEAIDNYNRKSSETLPIKVTPVRDAPAVSFLVNGVEADELHYREGEQMPAIKINATSAEALLNLYVTKLVNRIETIIPINENDTVEFSGNEKEYAIDLSSENNLFEPNITALKAYVSAGDPSKPKIKVAVLKVNYIEATPPGEPAWSLTSLHSPL
jgi:hypothetical protein